MTSRFRLIALLVAVSATGWTQTTLSYPGVSGQQCEGSHCPESSPDMQSVPSGVRRTPEVPRGYGNERQGFPSRTSGQSSPIIPERREGSRVIERDLEYPRPEERVPEQRLEFQDFVLQSIGKDLEVYGTKLFEMVPSTFAPVDRVPVTANYVIGPGDELLIRAWGQIDLDARVIVDRSGAIYLPKVGNVNVAGLQYEQVQSYLKTAIGRVFKSFDLNVNLGQLRSIQVFVVGQARRPGAYTVSSLSTLVNTLFASGGPSLHGSLRHIQLRRNDQVVTEFDLYDLLLKGDKSKDAVLLPGDVIYIPAVGPLVALAGSVNVPGIYELRDNSETSLKQAIELAGGLSTTADNERGIIERIDDHHARKVDEFPLDGEGAKHALRDGDLVRVVSVSPRFENAVMLRGNVAQPGRYPWHAGMRVRDLIPDRTALITREYWNNQNAVSAASVGAGNTGEAKARSVIRNEVKRSGPDVNWDYALVQRVNIADLSTRLIPFSLAKAIVDGDPEQNLELRPGDIVTIFSQTDIPGPLEKQTKLVHIEGEFAAAGVYRARPAETLRQIVKRVGLSPQAYLYGAVFTRMATQQRQQEGLDRMARDMEAQLERNAATVDRNLSPEQASVQAAEFARQRDFIGRLRQVKATGRVVLELRPGDNAADDFPDIPLEDGDQLLVPNKGSTIEIIGSVYNPNSFFFRPGQTVHYYLQQAGGANRQADRSQMFIVRADGSVVSRAQTSSLWRHGFEELRIYPGDTVVVPEYLEKGAGMRLIKDISQVISQFALGAAAIKVLQ